MLKIENLTVDHGAIRALHGVTFNIEKGQLAAVIGANGAGKTTLLRTLSGLNKASEGAAHWGEHNILHAKPESLVRHGISHVSEGKSYHYSGNTLVSHPFTQELEVLKNKIETTCGVSFNCVLANLYRDGKDSNGWHADNEKELGRNPVIASISLGTERRFDMKHTATGVSKQLLLPHGSLLIMGGSMQHHWKHCIAKSKKVFDPRINLTFRNLV
jgi:alkylated DNA repair dioxygenase AlkB